MATGGARRPTTAHVFHFNDSGQVSESWVVNYDPYAVDEFFAD